MPEPYLNAYARMRPRILAEQSRRRINELLAANGRALKDPEQKKFIGQLDEEMDGGRTAEPMRPTLGQLERMGLRVVREEVSST